MKELKSFTLTVALSAALILSTFAAPKSSVKYSNGTLNVRNADAAELAKACADYPDATRLYIFRAMGLTSFDAIGKLSKLKDLSIECDKPTDKIDPTPLKNLTELTVLKLSKINLTTSDLTFLEPLKKLTRLSLEYMPDGQSYTGIEKLPLLNALNLDFSKVDDLTPVGQCAKLRTLTLKYSTLKDFAPLASLTKVAKINLYAAKVQDFAPLANMKGLKTLYFYAAEVPADKWMSLGALKQVTTFHGGMTSLNTLEWVKETPKIETLELFREKITDYSPLATAANLKRFKAWNMPLSVDLAFVKNCPKLKEVELPTDKVENFDALGACKKLQKLEIRTNAVPTEVLLKFEAERKAEDPKFKLVIK